MKEKILKLLNSGNEIDIIIGITLAITLSRDDFHDIFPKRQTAEKSSYTPKYFSNKSDRRFIGFSAYEVEYHIDPDGGLHMYFGEKNIASESEGWVDLGNLKD